MFLQRAKRLLTLNKILSAVGFYNYAIEQQPRKFSATFSGVLTPFDRLQSNSQKMLEGSVKY